MTTTPRIVVIDDHPLMREALVTRILAAVGAANIVYSGGSLQAALRAIGTAGADCVVLDLDLGDGNSPVANTVDLVEADARVLIVSALADPATVRAALRAGALGFVSKAAAPDDFTESLRATLRGEPSTSRDVAAILYGDTSTKVALTERERTAMVLYASGLKIDAVARRMGVKPSTAQEYIKRVREKYLRAGTPLPSKVHLYRQAKEEGLVP